MAKFNRRKSSVTTRSGATDWQKNLRRTDVTDNVGAKPLTSSYVRPKRQSTEMWQAVAPIAEGNKVDSRRLVKESKLSLVDEEDIFAEEVFDDVTNNNHVQAGASSRPAMPRRSRKSTVGSIGSQHTNEDVENRGAMVKKGPRRSRRSTLGSIGSLNQDHQEVFVMDDIGPTKEAATKKAAVRAPKKSKKGLTLPVPVGGMEVLSPNKLSPLAFSGLTISSNNLPDVTRPKPLPPGVVCIDLEDGTEEAYFSDIIHYKKAEEEVYAAKSNFTKWKLRDCSERRSVQTRTLLLDWIIEVVHYFKAGQETLYNSVHLIDRYICAKYDQVVNTDIQMVGTAAVLIATKLEEYHPADIGMLSRLTDHSVSEDQIRQMELEMMLTLEFNTYCLDPMIFLHRFIRAAFRQDDRLFIEACCLLLDASITTAAYWSITTSKKCAAAVCAALALIPPESADGEPRNLNFNVDLWTPTLRYYTGYEYEQVELLGMQMLGVVEKILCLHPEQDSGLRVKYSSVSRHQKFLSTVYCGINNLTRASQRMMAH